MTKHNYQPIENYGLIGNMETAALVGMNGSIDFLCFPRFDSPSVFARLLDHEKGGYFSIIPQMKDMRYKQLYLPETAVLITRFFSEEGIVEVTDYMPLNEGSETQCNSIVRKVKSIRGDVTCRLDLQPRFDYAQKKHTIERDGDILLFKTATDEQEDMRFMASFDVEIDDQDVYAEFSLKESERAFVVLELSSNGDTKFNDISYYTKETYFSTIAFWRNWVNQSSYSGRWKEVVQRSAITLKLLTSARYGSVVAAATFSLPEELNGDRNWDYRFTWIRDAAFTMYAFLKLGFVNESTAFLKWIIEQDKNRDLHLLYKIDGEWDLEEKILEHFEGYKGSGPVRIGNEANNQLQLDIYGELLDTIYIYNQYHQPITFELWEIICKEIKIVIERWREPDHGIWEIRNEKQEFLHSRLMCWVAMDRAIKIGTDRSFPFPVGEWIDVRNQIYKDIFDNFWNEEKQMWAQFKRGDKVSDTIDGSVLLMPLLHFVTPEEPRWIKTLEAVDEQLRLDVLVYRYNNEEVGIDGLEGEEGTFTMCSFWYIECLAKAGRIEEAVENFAKMIGYANHLGLFAEMISKKGQHLGNFPQAFTHLGLISAALELDKQLSRRVKAHK
ncbi:glycoside hydrolase family 15 protein [Sphingobacterium oryzagri]|uniref:Glycoside hydrolase family 15 protein n=1 Tax=Sphingobacterium oryzagri TaxID=3025669 RepID=A0ABY7WL52_9SPHI|nr:glycoside hydrolase family 15 protein [Sphingobacterium sp. KACC 22765]WDF69176.1 glycoside hydrolase family 15 protein [Sphingobacterium sp. KACC 22765]